MFSKVVDTVLGKKVRDAARNISENGLCLKERWRGLYWNRLSNRSYENEMNVKKLEKVLK